MANQDNEVVVDSVDEKVEETEQAPVTQETKSKAETKEEKLEIEVVDDTPAEDRGRKPMKTPPKDPSKDEVQEYNAKVQKRVDELKRAWHDERREKEKAGREQAEALAYAKQVLEENNKLKKQLSEGEKALMDHAKKKAETSVEIAKRNLQSAQEAGDASKISEAMTDLTQQSVELENWKRYTPQHDGVPEDKPPLQESKKDVPLDQSVQQPAPPPDEKALSWYNKNTWFGVDDELTSFAYGLHSKLVKQGVDPRTDDYYEKIDTRLREVFPEKFDAVEVNDEADTTSKENNPQQDMVVAPATRTTPRKKITLTRSQVNIAKRLGVPLEVYAKQVALQEKRNNG